MNALEKYHDQVIEPRPTNFEVPPESGSETTSGLIVAMLRRWYIVLLVFFIMCSVGAPAIWFSIEPFYDVTGAIRVAPILPNILTGEADRGEISNYQSFMNTQAEMVTSSQVVQRVADNLADKNLAFFESEASKVATKLKLKLKNDKTKPEPASILKQAISNGIISVVPGKSTELIKVTMKSTNVEEGKQIVDAFIRAYMAIEVSSSTQSEDRKLTVLEDERKILAEKLQNQRATIRQLAQEYGTTALGDRQDMMLQRVTTLLGELTKLEARRINLEAQVQLLEQTKEQAIPTEQLLKMQQEYINADPMINVLTENIAQLDQALIVAKQTLAPTNPELKRKAELLEALKVRLEERKNEAGEAFGNLMSQELVKTGSQKLVNTRTELEQTKAYEKRLQEVLTKEDTQTIELGRKQLTIQDLQFQLDLDREMYDTVCRRIRELEMERKRPARISVAYDADVASIRDKRIKYTAALIFTSFAAGCFLAFLKDKADYSIYTPDDITKRVGVRIIGTITNADYLDRFKLPQQIANDYQTIRANLGLQDGDGIPNKLVITSAGTCDGKTTFAINLATSLAKAGKKVLLVDGDLRKPDIRRLLNLPKDSMGLQDVLLGESFENVVHPIPSGEFDVLTADSRNASDGFELLSLPDVSKYLNLISAKYDHVIIDTPPVLAFPDALILAKMADGVILTSFAGHTEEQDLRDTLKRLAQVKVKVLGTVLSNVRLGHSYYRYSYDYYAHKAVAKHNRRKSDKTMFLLPAKESNKTPDGSKS